MYFIDTFLGGICNPGDCGEGLVCVDTECKKKSEEENTECPAGWIPLANTCPEEGDDPLCVTIGAPLKVCKLLNVYQTLLCLMR